MTGVYEWEFGYLTAEARKTWSKQFLIKKYSELCELGVSVVKKKSEQFDPDWINETKGGPQDATQLLV